MFNGPSLKKACFPSSIRYQLQIAPWLGMGPYICPLCFVCAGIFNWIEFVQTMSMPPLTPWVHVYIDPVLSGKQFPWKLKTLLPPLLQKSLSFEGKDLIKTSHLGLKDPRSLTVCKLSSRGPLCWVTIHCISYFDEGGAAHWSMGITVTRGHFMVMLL